MRATEGYIIQNYFKKPLQTSKRQNAFKASEKERGRSNCKKFHNSDVLPFSNCPSFLLAMSEKVQRPYLAWSLHFLSPCASAKNGEQGQLPKEAIGSTKPFHRSLNRASVGTGAQGPVWFSSLRAYQTCAKKPSSKREGKNRCCSRALREVTSAAIKPRYKCLELSPAGQNIQYIVQTCRFLPST